tara:strand:- start:1 stop:1671 length:1671 start_codon:yes stop_codon:yes gene_type:complete
MAEKRIKLILMARDKASGVLAGASKKFNRSIASGLSRTAKIVGIGGLGLGAAFVGFGVKIAAELEQAEVAFTTMLGSSELAKKTLTELQQFAASTPFQFTELVDASKKLIAFGVPVENLQDELRAIGDISAGVGAPITEIAEIYGKAKVQGRLFAEDINQLTGRGIPIIGELAKQFGVAESEVRKLVESGKVGFPHIQTAFDNLTAKGGPFFNLMTAQSRTLSGLWSTFKDNIALAAAEIGTALLPTLKSTMTFLLENMNSIIATSKEVGTAIASTIGSAISTAVGLFQDFPLHAEIGVLSVAKFFVDLKDKIVNVFDNIGGRIGNFFANLIEDVKLYAKVGGVIIAELASNWSQLLTSALTMDIDGLKNAARASMEAAISRADELVADRDATRIGFTPSAPTQSDAAKSLGNQIVAAQSRLAKNAANRANDANVAKTAAETAGKIFRRIPQATGGSVTFDTGTEAERKAARTNLAGIGDLFAPDKVAKADRGPLEALALSAGFTGLASRFRSGEEPAAKTAKNTEKANTELVTQTEYLRRIAEVSRSAVGLPVFT